MQTRASKSRGEGIAISSGSSLVQRHDPPGWQMMRGRAAAWMDDLANTVFLITDRIEITLLQSTDEVSLISVAIQLVI